eukprot:1175510-Prorocentrum_minimum.AAC.1
MNSPKTRQPSLSVASLAGGTPRGDWAPPESTGGPGGAGSVYGEEWTPGWNVTTPLPFARRSSLHASHSMPRPRWGTPGFRPSSARAKYTGVSRSTETSASTTEVAPRPHEENKTVP